jgi:hypothetical protein
MGLDPNQFAMQMRSRGFVQQCDGSWAPAGDVPPAPVSKGVERENTLQRRIREWCKLRWPEWVPYGPRMDVPSTVDEGGADLIVFGPFPIVLVVETKARDRKQSGAQLAWACKMKAIGWTVHVIRNEDQWRAIADGKV